MMFHRFYNAEMMNGQSASAPCANADVCCACANTAAHTAIMTMDAIFVASIIILCGIILGSLILTLGLFSLLAILGLIILVLVALLVSQHNTPWSLEPTL